MATFSVTVDARPKREQTDGPERVYPRAGPELEPGSGVEAQTWQPSN